MPKIFTAFSVAGILFLCQLTISHALDVFVLIDGVQGEEMDPLHPGWIRVQNVTWGHGEAPPGSAVKVQFERFVITKVNDSTSALLAQAAATGQPFKDVKLEMVKTVEGSKKVVVNRIKLVGARVAHYQASAHGGGQIPADSISFSFDKITWINFKLDNLSRQLPGSAGCFDLKANTACPPTF